MHTDPLTEVRQTLDERKQEIMNNVKNELYLNADPVYIRGGISFRTVLTGISAVMSIKPIVWFFSG